MKLFFFLVFLIVLQAAHSYADDKLPSDYLEINCHKYLQGIEHLRKRSDQTDISFVAKRVYKRLDSFSDAEKIVKTLRYGRRALLCSKAQEKRGKNIGKPRPIDVFRIKIDSIGTEYRFSNTYHSVNVFEYIPDERAVIDIGGSPPRTLRIITQKQLDGDSDIFDDRCVLVNANTNVVGFPVIKVTSDARWLYFAERELVKDRTVMASEEDRSGLVSDNLAENTSYYPQKEKIAFRAILLDEHCLSQERKNSTYDGGDQTTEQSVQPVNLTPARFGGRILDEIDSIDIDGITVGEKNETLRFVYVSTLENSASIDTEIMVNEVTYKDNEYVLKKAVSISDRKPGVDGWDSKPKFSPSQKYVSFIRRNDPIGEAAGNSIQLVRLGDRLPEKYSIDLRESRNILVKNKIIEYHWSCGGDCIFVMVEEHGKSVIYKVASNDHWSSHESPRAVLDVGSYSHDFVEFNNGLGLALIKSTLVEPPKFIAYQFSDEKGKFENRMKECFRNQEPNPINCSLNINEYYKQEQTPFPLLKEMLVKTENGNIHTFLLLPPDYSKQEKKEFPAIVMIHGGPTNSWKNIYDPQLISWAKAGYIVILPNLPGSSGYGGEFTDLSKNGWGTTIYEGLKHTVQSLLIESQLVGEEYEKIRIDQDNMSIMGGSFGGYMVALVATKGLDMPGIPDFRFKAGVFINGIYDLRSWATLTDQLWYPADQLSFTPSTGKIDRSIDPSAMADKLRNQSPPILLIAGDEDLRVPREQAISFHRALVDACVPSRLIVLKNEAHGLSHEAHPLVEVSVLSWLSQFTSGGRGFVEGASEEYTVQPSSLNEGLSKIIEPVPCKVNRDCKSFCVDADDSYK